MNTTFRIAAVATTALIATLAAAGSAFAAEAEQYDPAPSTLSRAAVVAELAQARARGELVSSNEADQRVDRLATSTRSRTEVRAEARYAARHHVINDYTVGG